MAIATRLVAASIASVGIGYGFYKSGLSEGLLRTAGNARLPRGRAIVGDTVYVRNTMETFKDLWNDQVRSLAGWLVRE